MRPLDRSVVLAVLLGLGGPLASCGGSRAPAKTTSAPATELRASVVAFAAPGAGTETSVPAPVLRDIEAYVAKRLPAAHVTPIDAASTAAAREGSPACAADDGEACLRAIGAASGAGLLVSATIARTGAHACSVSVKVVTLDATELPEPKTHTSDRCRLQSLEVATEAALTEHPLLRSLRGSPPPPHPACEDICTAAEKSCDSRSTTLCGDGNWDGCTDWIATPCATAQGCSKGTCIPDKPDMVLVGEGPFLMGSGPKQLEHAMEKCRARNYACVDSWWRPEQPAHWVQVSGFYIDRTEVTNAAYADCVKAGRCKKPDFTKCGTWDPRRRDWIIARAGLSPDMTGPTKPAVCVSQDEADRYCKWAGKRLPTEAEWEKAARGTDSRLYPWGDATYDGTQANGCDKRCGEVAGKGWRAEPDLDDKAAYLAAAGGYLAGASPYGALDMAGNAWEWVADWFDEDYYKVSERKDPTGPATPGERPLKVLRGGSWSNEPDSLRSSYRYSLEPTQRLVTVGFRCAYP